MKLGILNERGLEAAVEWIIVAKENRADDGVRRKILSDPSLVDLVRPDVDVQQRTFASRLEAAVFLHPFLAKTGLTNVISNRGLWTWLTLYYWDSVAPADADGKRKVGEIARYVLDPDFRKYYRHLLAGPHQIFHAYDQDPQKALSILCQPLHVPGELVEQVASRQDRVSNPCIVSLASRLYVDPKKGTIKKGAGSKSAGSIRRLIAVMGQFDMTLDLYAAEPAELLKMLPSEFNRFI